MSAGKPAVPAPMPGDQVVVDAFKSAFRGHPAGVSIVAADGPTGRSGLTLSSLASVGVDPAAVAFSVTSTRGSAGRILTAPSFAVSLLGRGQASVAADFARPGRPRFSAGQSWTAFATGEPYLVSARVSLRCRPLQIVPSGGSSLVLAEVCEIRLGPPDAPLIYVDRSFRDVGAEIEGDGVEGAAVVGGRSARC